MVANQALVQTVAQKMTMSKQMQQSLHILQMPTIDLFDYINNEVGENPFLDKLDNNTEYFNDEFRYQTVSNRGIENNYDPIAQLADNNITLKDHLITQINISIDDERDKIIAIYLIDLLDENGYFTCSKSDLHCSKERLSAVLEMLYKLEPIGCFAFNLRDCLTIQLKERKVFNNQYSILLDNLNLVALGNIKKLKSLCQVSEEDIKAMIQVIKSLNPKPGRDYSNVVVQTKIPDAILEFNEKEEVNIRLNESYMPKVSINSDSYADTLANSKQKSDKSFCKEKYKRANFVQKALIQRAETIFKIANLIAQEQYEFFEKGVHYLKPMTLGDVANKIDVHESTVSRCNNKIIRNTCWSI